MTFREIDGLLKADGWKLIRVLDSVHQYRKVGIKHFVMIPDRNNNEISVGIIKDLENKTGLSFRR